MVHHRECLKNISPFNSKAYSLPSTRPSVRRTIPIEEWLLWTVSLKMRKKYETVIRNITVFNSKRVMSALFSTTSLLCIAALAALIAQTSAPYSNADLVKDFSIPCRSYRLRLSLQQCVFIFWNVVLRTTTLKFWIL